MKDVDTSFGYSGGVIPEGSKLGVRTVSSPSKFYDGSMNEMGDTTFDSTDEEFLAKYMTNISSASSSISWAEDAVEAEMTKKIFCLWEDIQRVCISEILERPNDMSIQVYEECLNWKRAFPFQDLAKYSRFTEEDLTPTPTPTKGKNELSPQGSSYKCFSPQSPNPPCVTPNPEKNASYVAMWLSDCQNQVPDSKEVEIAENVESLSLSDTKKPSFSNAVVIPYYQPPSTATENLSTIRNSESMHPDPNNFFTSLALNNIISSANRMHGRGENCTDSGGVLRVQRPISSNVKGHLITPLRTNYSHPSVSRSFREAGGTNGMAFRFADNFNSRNPNRSNVTLPKGKTAPVHPVCPPIISSKERSAGPRRTHSNSTGNASSAFSHSGLSTLPYGRQFYGGRDPDDKLSPARTPISATFQSNSSSNNSSSRTIENDYNGVAKATTWSRHSSISESYSYSVTNTGELSKKSEVDTRYFETISENYNTQTSVKISRPDYLPISKEAELNPSMSKPVRPFLYWLLDKVSPG